jgi:excinuclease UvrABC ATPase subunit
MSTGDHGRREIPDRRLPFGSAKHRSTRASASADPDRQLRVVGATGNNLQCVDLEIPVGLLTCITGVSGSGKSTLINSTLYPVAATALNGATTLTPAAHSSQHEGLEHIDKCIDIDQSPIGRTPRSNPATYTGIFTPDSRTVRRHPGSALPRLQARALQLQR